MLTVVAQITPHYLTPIQQHPDFSCRAITSVTTASGEKHLVCTRTLETKFEVASAEELMVLSLISLYKNDPAIIVKNRNNHIEIKIDTMFLDVEPSDRTKRDHVCRLFFSEEGRQIKIDDKTYTVKFTQGMTYWHEPFSLSATQTKKTEKNLLNDLAHYFKNKNELIHAFKRCYALNSDIWLDYQKIQLAVIDLNHYFPKPPSSFLYQQRKRKREAETSCSDFPRLIQSPVLFIQNHNRFYNREVYEAFEALCTQYDSHLSRYVYDVESMKGFIFCTDLNLLETLSPLLNERTTFDKFNPCKLEAFEAFNIYLKSFNNQDNKKIITRECQKYPNELMGCVSWQKGMIFCFNSEEATLEIYNDYVKLLTEQETLHKQRKINVG